MTRDWDRNADKLRMRKVCAVGVLFTVHSGSHFLSKRMSRANCHESAILSSSFFIDQHFHVYTNMRMKEQFQHWIPCVVLLQLIRRCIREVHCHPRPNHPRPPIDKSVTRIVSCCFQNTRFAHCCVWPVLSCFDVQS